MSVQVSRLYRRRFPRIRKTNERSLGKTTISGHCLQLYKTAAHEWEWSNVSELYTRAVNAVVITTAAKFKPKELEKVTEAYETTCLGRRLAPYTSCYTPNPAWTLKVGSSMFDREIGFGMHKSAENLVSWFCEIAALSKAGFYRWALERWILHKAKHWELPRELVKEHVVFTKKWKHAAVILPNISKARGSLLG